MISQNIAKQSITISVMEKGDDAEFYKLVPVYQKAIVSKAGTLGVQFQYNIQHIVGSTISNISANTESTIGNYYVRFRTNTTTTYTNLSSGTTAPNYTNSSYQQNYHQQTTQIAYFIIQLVRVTSTSGSVTIVDRVIVPVVFAAGATLQITDEIQATVADHTTQIGELDGRITTNTNNISQVTQTANSLSSTVAGHTTSINTLNGTVSGHTTQISSLQQTANGLTSQVEAISVGARNLLRGSKKLNPTYCTTNGTKSSAINNTTTNYGSCYSIRANGKTDANVDLLAWNSVITPEPETYYTLSFWCKGTGVITSYFYPSTICYGYNSDGDVYGSTTNTSCGDGALETTLTSDWKRVWVVWKTGTTAKMTSGMKNVLVARLMQGSTSNIAYICGAKLEKGSLATDYSEAPEDIDDRFAEDANIFKGSSYDGGFISPNSPNNRWVFQENTMTAYNLVEYESYGSLFYDGSFTLVPRGNGTAYLYSPYFYASGQADYTLNLGEYDNSENTIKVELVKFSSYTNAQNLTSPSVAASYSVSYHRQFTISQAGYYRLRFSTTVTDYNADEYDYGWMLQEIRLYKGKLSEVDIPEWNNLASSAYSKIVQTANDITLQVQDVALRIDNKKIVLDGDTEVNGSLTLDNSDQGFLLVGNGGTTRISPQSIGTYANFSSQSTQTVTTSVNSYCVLAQLVEGNYHQGYFNTSASLGEQPSGSYLTLKNHSVTFRKNNSGTILTGYDFKATYTIYEDGVSKKTVVLTNQSSNNITTYTTSAQARITIGLSVEAKFLKSYWNEGTNNNHTPSVLEPPTVIGSLYFQTDVPTTAFMLIGYDGLAVNFGNSKTAYFGAEGATIRYGTQGLQINNNGIKKLNPNGGGQWTNLSTQKVTTLPNSDYTLQDADEFLIAKSSSYTSDHKLYLPATTYTGRKIYVKDMSGATIQVYCSGRLVSQNSNSTTNQINVNNTAGMFIFDGTNWYYYYCG